MFRSRTVLIPLAIISSLALAPRAHADGIAELLRLEFRNVAANASPPVLSDTYTGSVAFSDDANSVLFRVDIGGMNQGALTDFDHFDAEFEFVDGAMTSGYIHAIVPNPTGPPTVFHTEYDQVTGFIFNDFGALYEIQFVTANTGFTREVYSGADVSPWAGAFSPSGATFITQLAPEAAFGIDIDVNFRIELLENKSTAADLNGDGVVDSSDLAILLAVWGPAP